MGAKEYDFVITLQPPDYKWVDRVSILLCFLSILLFLNFIITEGFRISNNTVIYIIALAIVAAQFVFNNFVKRGYLTNNRIAFMAIAVSWGITNNIWLGFLYLIAAILEPKIKFPDEIGFDKQGITKNTLIKKSWLWNELNNVVLKDNILTIDFKNNSIFQKETESDVDNTIQNEFNDFCRHHLSALNYQSSELTNS